MTGSLERRHRLLDRWSRSVATLLPALETRAFVPALLAAVQRLVHADFIMVFGYAGREKPQMLGDTLDRGRHRVIADDYVNGPYLLDPFYQLTQDGVRQGCFRLLDIAPDRFRQSAYYRKHYVRTGIGEEVGFVFAAGAGITGVASVARWVTSPGLSREELELLRVLSPAIEAFCAQHWSRMNRVTLVADSGAPASPVISLENFAGGILSARERQIMTMILQGHSTESLAQHLDISPGTVKIHRKNVYRKLRISTQAELFAAYLAFVQNKDAEAGVFPEGYTARRKSSR
ncbi:MAG: LuxR C-terminal-related transcriptional regulator [Parvibaculaceae bacterium]